MTAATKQKLERLRNRTTLYEFALFGPGGRKVLLGYSPKTRRKLAFWVRTHALRIAELTGATSYELDRGQLSASLYFGDNPTTLSDVTPWIVQPTGRTERQSVTEGELDWIGETAPE